MKAVVPIIICAGACMALAACHTPQETDMAPAAPVSTFSPVADTAIVELYRHDQEEQAIIRQQTLYPYHFVEGGAELNAAGQREVHVLARHYASVPGSLSIRKGDASDELYQQRVDAVLAAMTEAGLDSGRISVVDELPGGDGIPSSMALLILQKEREQSGQQEQDDSQSSMDSSTGGNAGTGVNNQ